MPDAADRRACELTPDDLFRTCEACGGTGQYERRSETSAGVGSGGVSYTERGTCPECLGHGATATVTGKAILEFLRKFPH